MAGTLAKLKEKVDNETLDTAGLRIKFAEEARSPCPPLRVLPALQCKFFECWLVSRVVTRFELRRN